MCQEKVLTEKQNMLREAESEEMGTSVNTDADKASEETPSVESFDQITPDGEPVAGEEGSDPLALLEEQLKAAEFKLNEASDRMLRMAAEFDNYKKRMAREMDEFRKFANESLIKNLLPILDNLERAIDSSKSGEKAKANILEGVELTYKEIMSILEKYQVLPVVCLEKSFDPLFHQAVSQEESDKYPDNTVIRELMKGYTMHDRLIRPSMVTVSKAKANQKKNEDIHKNEKTINETA